MARYQRRRTWVKVVAVLVVLIAMAYVITSLAMGGKWNPLDWVKKDESQNTAFVGKEEDSVYSSDGKLMRIEKTMGARTVNENGDEVTSYTLNIKVTPAESELTNFVWTADFKNAASEWANGKAVTDYVKITPAENNRSATVECLQAFGEPIAVKCAWAENTTLSATCKFDYVKRVVGGGDCDFAGNNFNDDGYYDVHVSPVYGVGTVTGQGSNYSGWVELSDEAYNYLTDSTSPAYTYYSRWLSSGGGELRKVGGTMYDNDPDYPDWFNAWAGDFVTNIKVGNQNYLLAAFKVLAQNTVNQFRVGYQYTYSYGDSFTQTATIYSDYRSMDPSYFETNLLTVNGVEMEQTESVF